MSNTAQVVIGIILLLPGLCSLAFMLPALPNLLEGGRGMWGLWAPCLLVSAFGFVMIKNADGPIELESLMDDDEYRESDDKEQP